MMCTSACGCMGAAIFGESSASLIHAADLQDEPRERACCTFTQEGVLADRLASKIERQH